MNGIDEKTVHYLSGRARTLREDLIEMFHSSGKGHVGGSLSIVEIMAALYFHVMRVDPGNPGWPDRDRLVLSKGHAAATWYAALAERGFFPKALLTTDYIRLGGILQEHCDMLKVPGVDMSSGALGQGLSVGLGMCLAGRLQEKDFRVFVILGDGEMQSGQVWEAVMAAGHYRTGRLTAIVDYNRLQVNDRIENVMDIAPLGPKFEAFGWRVTEIDGNDMRQVAGSLAADPGPDPGKPSVIICHTVKGKGISFVEDNVHWHSHTLDTQQYHQALKELADAGDQGREHP